MVIVYESKTGFTKRYAEMLAEKASLSVFRAQERSKIDAGEEVLFLGWMKVGKIQGLSKMRKHNVVAVCGSGTAAIAEPSPEVVIERKN